MMIMMTIIKGACVMLQRLVANNYKPATTACAHGEALTISLASLSLEKG